MTQKIEENLTNSSNLKTNSEIPPGQIKYTTATAVVVFSLLAGVLGGMYGAIDLAQRPIFKKWFGGGGSTANFSQTVTVNEESVITDMVKKAGPAVVSVVVTKDLNKIPTNPFGFFAPSMDGDTPNLRQVGAGTGFFVSDDGLILTNKHVVSDGNASYSIVTNDGKTYDVKVLSFDPVNDLAILKAEVRGVSYLEFADSSKLELGQHVVAIGNSLGEYQNTVTSGIVSGIGRSIVAGGAGMSEQLEGVIQTDAAINPGNSGGPLLDFSGRVIGINTAVDQQGQLVGFAIPSNDAKAALESFNRTGKITRPFIGVRYVMVNEALVKSRNLGKDYGALILPSENGQNSEPGILPNSPAAKAGLKENDIILELNNQKLTEENSLAKEIKKYKIGDNIALKVWRDGKEISINLNLGEINK